MTMCVSALALTSLDAVARIGRMSFQELFSIDDMEHAEGWRKLFCNVYFSTIITLAFGFLLTQIGYANIWPLFGSANQLLSALVLATLCVFLKVTGRNNKMLFPPLIIMLCVTFTALVQRLIAMVKAICCRCFHHHSRWRDHLGCRVHRQRPAADPGCPADRSGPEHCAAQCQELQQEREKQRKNCCLSLIPIDKACIVM